MATPKRVTEERRALGFFPFLTAAMKSQPELKREGRSGSYSRDRSRGGPGLTTASETTFRESCQRGRRWLMADCARAGMCRPSGLRDMDAPPDCAGNHDGQRFNHGPTSCRNEA